MEYHAKGGHPLLLEWHGSVMISRIVWEFVEGFLERISTLFGSDEGGRAFQFLTAAMKVPASITDVPPHLLTPVRSTEKLLKTVFFYWPDLPEQHHIILDRSPFCARIIYSPDVIPVM